MLPSGRVSTPKSPPRICQYRVPRLLFALFRPRVFQMWNADWPHLHEVMRAHSKVQQASLYVALVFEKPEA